ncbi:proton-coupled folate transporter-like [Danaus plexippus]|uniref:proton-coupled folate transporter-like n=1 Tax=Danaus plexippus TaxID=13037 RepID=UPI002AB09664|nr:proton-coupled folate transporter-like [Danaus plexippus]
MAENLELYTKPEETPLNETKDPDLHKKYEEKSFTEKLRDLKKNITVEPMLAGFVIPSVISKFAMGYFNLYKVCRINFEYPEDICNPSGYSSTNYTSVNATAYERDVQKVITSMDIWKSIINTVLPCIVIVFLAAWSDRTGKRKLVILLPIFGELITSVNNIINVYFFKEIPVELTVFLESLFTSVSGGWVLMFLGVFSYISDITTEQSRTFRVGLVNFCMTVGIPIGIGISGILITNLGFYALFSVTFALFLLVFVYGIICIKEPDDILKEKGLPIVQRDVKAKVSFFAVSNVIDTIKVAFRKRPSNRRMKVILTLIAVLVLYGPSMSENSIFYLFLRNRLRWDVVQYSVYLSYSTVLHSVGAMTCITIFSKKLQIDDALLCLISIASKFVGSVWTAFAKANWEIYMIPVAEIFTGTTFTSLRSIMSKLIDQDETAKVNSLFSLTETLASLIFQPFYSWLYMNTLQAMSGAVFLTSASLIVPASFILTVFYILSQRELSKARRNAHEEEEKKKFCKNTPA